MLNTADGFFELHSRQSEVASAVFADYPDIAPDTHHTKIHAFRRAGVGFFHFEYISDKDLRYCRHDNTSQKYIYIVSIPQIQALVQSFFTKKHISFRIAINYLKEKFIFLKNLLTSTNVCATILL